MLTTECSTRRKPSCRDKGWGGVDEGALCLSSLGCGLCAPRSPQGIALPPGQAPGPHPSPHPPLVPTERRGRTHPDGRDYPLRLEKFISRSRDWESTTKASQNNIGREFLAPYIVGGEGLRLSDIGRAACAFASTGRL